MTKLYKILRIEKELLEKLDIFMTKLTGKRAIIEGLEKDIARQIDERFEKMEILKEPSAGEVVSALTKEINNHENQLYNYLGIERGDFDTPEGSLRAFEKVKKLAYKITSAKEGFFLKREKAEEILRKNMPYRTIEYFKYKDIDELLSKQDINEVMSALRFTETDKWMHQTFDVAYSAFTPKDFEYREIELRILGEQWHKIALKFVAKKHHNVSHLKEFGVIFLNPIDQGKPGALLRDFALFFHYFHEIAFYSKLFEYHSNNPDFNETLKSFLRGDVLKKNSVKEGEWLIVQRYLWKSELKDPRLFLPRVNPESRHWHRGEQDLVKFGKANPRVGLDFWDNLDWVADYFLNEKGKKELISFDMEDNAMTFAQDQRSQLKYGYIWYHQQEALWNELFKRYMGRKEFDSILIKNFNKGSIELA